MRQYGVDNSDCLSTLTDVKARGLSDGDVKLTCHRCVTPRHRRRSPTSSVMTSCVTTSDMTSDNASTAHIRPNSSVSRYVSVHVLVIVVTSSSTRLVICYTFRPIE